MERVHHSFTWYKLQELKFFFDKFKSIKVANNS